MKMKMKEQNELLRSAFEIAQRHGNDTNWEAFARNVKAELIEQGGVDANNEQQVLRSTCTPKTYRMASGDHPTDCGCVNCRPII